MIREEGGKRGVIMRGGGRKRGVIRGGRREERSDQGRKEGREE